MWIQHSTWYAANSSISLSFESSGIFFPQDIFESGDSKNAEPVDAEPVDTRAPSVYTRLIMADMCSRSTQQYFEAIVLNPDPEFFKLYSLIHFKELDRLRWKYSSPLIY